MQGDAKSKKRVREGKPKGKDEEAAVEEEHSEVGDNAERKKSKRSSGGNSRR